MINVVYSGNTAVFDGFLISLLSMAQNTKESLSVYILTADFSDCDKRFIPIGEKQRAILEKTIKRYNPSSFVTIIDVRGLFDEKLSRSINIKNQYTPYALLRLLMDLIPAMPERLLYIDADTIVTGDVKELYEYDLKGKTVGGVRDYLGRFFIGVNYINSGVLLIDLKKAKEEKLFERARAIVNDVKMPFPDQSALNKCLSGRKAFLPRKFNAMRHLNKRTIIRHYSKMIVSWIPFKIVNVKPWQIDEMHRQWKVHVHDALFADYLKIKSDISQE
ncbi:MAG: glycosyltransferase [Bacilli bacterium]|jgi:lipopolysaccharide biosynthesis glycosyltransferase